MYSEQTDYNNFYVETEFDHQNKNWQYYQFSRKYPEWQKKNNKK